MIRLRARILLEAAVREALSAPWRQKKLEAARSFEARGKGRRALVLANGPSTRTLHLHEVRSAQSAGLDVFAVNFFALGCDELLPNFYFLMDPSFFEIERCPAHLRQRVQALWKRLEAHPPETLVVPMHRDVPPGVHLASTVVYVDNTGLDGWTENWKPVRPRGYIGVVAYSALAFAKWMDYDSIYVLGFDNTAHHGVVVDSENRLVRRGQEHFYGSTPHAPDAVLPHMRDGMAAVHQDVARLFADLHILKDDRIYNLDPTSLVDAFQKADPEGLTISHP